MPNKTEMDAFQLMLLQLRNNFLDEVPERLDKLDTLLLKIEKTGVADESFNELCRIVHSPKGSGGTHGLHMLTTVCHQREDVLNVSASTGAMSMQLVNQCFAYVDLLRTTVEQIRQGENNFLSIEQKLEELRNNTATRQFQALLVDNSKVSTSIYTRVLQGYPITAVVMGDGYAALHRLLAEPFDLLICANEIPLLNGIALIGAVRLSSSRNRAIESILITSSPDKRNRLKGQTDANHVIAKDAHMAEKLGEIVAKVIKQQSTLAQLL